jgi:diguanylate cyclase (GGDEF)-like protein
MTDRVPEVEIDAAKKANDNYGHLILQNGQNLLSTKEGADLIDTLAENRTDIKTGVKNQRDLEEWLDRDERLHETAKKKSDERRKVAPQPILHGVMLFLDADGLGEANKLGHDKGDSLLKTVATAGKDLASRADDEVWRRGDNSDEFIIALPGASFKDFERIEQKFEDAMQKRSAGKAFSASIVMGSYGYTTTARERLMQLDQVLSAAKARVGKGVHIDTIFDKSNG